ncbi:PilW family protein [Salinicola halimionae]|uniref:PilW family protein n=1 Tax=Salinicola halimionae TaxID=1949081 RepID=UPI000DA24DCE|nr:PilW family protein [Salinicola halimionae]
MKVPRTQSGISLIELMVAMTIGLMLVMMVTSYLISSRQSYQTSMANVDVQDARRFALSVVQNQLWMTGYSDRWEDFDVTFPASDGSNGEMPDFGKAQLVAASQDDDIWIRYRAPELANQPLVNCDGTSFPSSGGNDANSIAMTRFYLSDRTLRCKVYPDSGEPHDALPLLNDVDALQWRYLDDSDQWQTLTTVDDWSTVRAIQMRLIVASSESTGSHFQQVFEWEGNPLNFDDGKARSLVSLTTALRNLPDAAQ